MWHSLIRNIIYTLIYFPSEQIHEQSSSIHIFNSENQYLNNGF